MENVDSGSKEALQVRKSLRALEGEATNIFVMKAASTVLKQEVNGFIHPSSPSLGAARGLLSSH